MIRNVLSAVAGYAAWTVIFLCGSAVIRAGMPAVHDPEGYTTNATALVLYLVVSFVASLAAGYLTGRIARGSRMMWVGVLAFLLVATGIPVQLSAWDLLPPWYNLVFLAALAPLTLLGGRASARDPVAPAS